MGPVGRRTWAAAGGLAVLVLGAGPVLAADSAAGLAGSGLAVPGAARFTVASETRALGGGATTYVARDRDRVLRLRVTYDVEPAAAAQHIAEQALLLESIFEPNLPPYPEFLTRETGCPEAFKPQKQHNRLGAYHLVHASERLGYGVCTDDLAFYRAAVGDFYCRESRRVFKVEFFVPKSAVADAATRLFDGLECR